MSTNRLFSTLFLGLVPLLFVTGTAAQTSAPGPLKVSTTNPRYFADPSGSAVFLAGAHTWEDNVDGWGMPNNCPTPAAFDWNGYLNFLQSHNYNFIRLWTWELPHSISEPLPAQTECHSPFPYLRTGPGTATDGGLQFDLTQFDQTFFDRLRQRVIDAGNHGVYVAIMLFEGASLDNDRLSTDGYWFTGANNVNGIDDGYTSGISGYQSQTMNIPAITAIQDAYVEKVIDTVYDLPNVLYEVANSPGRYATAWENHMISLVHSYEASKPFQHLVGFSCLYYGEDSTLYSSQADWVSVCDSGFSYPVTGTATGNKVTIVDTDDAWYWKFMESDTSSDPAAMRKWVWENFTRGTNPIFMDPYLVAWPDRNNPSGATLDPYWDPIRVALSQAVSYARRLNLSQATPQNSLCSTTFCLVSPGQQYLVYAPDGGSFTVNLQNGTYNYEWFNAGNNTVAQTSTLSANGTTTFNTPFAGDAVLLVTGAADFTLAANPSSVTVTPGKSASYTLKVNAVNGFNGAVSLHCASGLPAGATCSFSPATLAPGATSTLTIATSAGGSAELRPFGIAPLYGLVLPALGLVWLGEGGRRRWIYLGIAGLVIGILMLVGCGGGSQSPPDPPPPSPAQTGTFKVTITGTSGSLQQSTTVNLQIQ